MPLTTLTTAEQNSGNNIFHAVFGEWNGRENVCIAVANIRQEIASLIAKVATLDPIHISSHSLFPSIEVAIKELIRASSLKEKVKDYAILHAQSSNYQDNADDVTNFGNLSEPQIISEYARFIEKTDKALLPSTLGVIACARNMSINHYIRTTLTQPIVCTGIYNPFQQTIANVFFDENTGYHAINFSLSTEPFVLQGNIDYNNSSALTDTLHGTIYQTKLLMLFMYRGLKKQYQYYILTEMVAAQKFDDIVFWHKTTPDGIPIYRFLQAKHKKYDEGEIPARDLLNLKDGDFSLLKYLLSYLEIKGHQAFQDSQLGELCICTNADFKYYPQNQSKYTKILDLANAFELITEKDDILRTEPGAKKLKFKQDFPGRDKVFEYLRDPLRNTVHGRGKTDLDLNIIIAEFFGHLVFAVNQPNEARLEKIITEELGKTFNLENSTLVYSGFLNATLQWLAATQGKAISSSIADEFLAAISKAIDQLSFIGHTLNYKAKLKLPGINFIPEREILSFLQNDRHVMLYQTSGDLFLANIHVYQTLESSGQHTRDDSYIFMSLTTARRNRDKLIGALTKSPLLVLSCNKLLESGERLIQEIVELPARPKIILITTDKEQLTPQLTSTSAVTVVPSIHSPALHPTSQQVLETWPVHFQGMPTTLDKLTPNLEMLIDAAILAELVRSKKDGRTIEIGEEILPSKAREYYVSRTLSCRTGQLDEACLKENNEDIFAICGIDVANLQTVVVGNNVRDFTAPDTNTATLTRYIILTPDNKLAQFNELCIQYPTRSIHLLTKENNIWRWEKTQGRLTNLRRHMSKSTTSGFPTGVTLVADAPGMGKTIELLLRARRLQEDPALWVIYINLSTITARLNALEESIGETNEGIAKFLLPEASYLAQKILASRLHKEGKVSVFLDGLDEVDVDSRVKVIQLLRSLQTKQLHQVVVSMRNNIIDVLEDELGLFSTSLVPFNSEDSIDFFENFWKKTLGLTTIDRLKVEDFARKLTARLDTSANNNTAQTFVAIPLQAELLAQAFEEVFKACYNGANAEDLLPKAFNLDELYTLFITSKYKIFKNKLNLAEDKANLEDMFNLTTTHLNKAHQLFAFNTLFPNSGLAPNNTTEIKNNNLVIAAGLVNFVGEEPHFGHRTFTEYFAAAFLMRQLTGPQQSAYITFLQRNIFKTNYQMVRFFMEAHIKKLVEDSTLAKAWQTIIYSNLLPALPVSLPARGLSPLFGLPIHQGTTKFSIVNRAKITPFAWTINIPPRVKKDKDPLSYNFWEIEINETIELCDAVLAISDSNFTEPFVDPFIAPFATLKHILEQKGQKPVREAVAYRLKNILWHCIQVYQLIGRLFNNQIIQDFKTIRADGRTSGQIPLDSSIREIQEIIGIIHKDMEENNTLSPSITVLDQIFDKYKMSGRGWLIESGIKLINLFKIFTPTMATLFINLVSTQTVLNFSIHIIWDKLLNPLLSSIDKNPNINHNALIKMCHHFLAFQAQFSYGTLTLTPASMHNLLKLIRFRLESSVEATTLSICVSLLYLFNKVGIHLIRTETSILFVDPSTEIECSLLLKHTAHVWDLIQFKVKNPNTDKEFIERCEKKATQMNQQNQLSAPIKTLKRTTSGTFLPF